MAKNNPIYGCFFIVAILFNFNANSKEITKDKRLTDVVYRKDEDLAVYNLKLDRILLENAMLVYNDYDSEQVLLPFNVFMSAIEFPIEFDAVSKTASGWFISENQTFYLDLTKEIVTVKGDKNALTSEQVELHDDDLYVDIKQLEAWFPILLENDPNEQVINIEPILPIPIQVRIEKEEKRQKISSNKKKEDNYIHYEPPSFITFPSFNLSAQNDFTSREGNPQISLLASGLFAKQHSRLRVNHSPKKTSVKFTLEDKNTENDLFGLMGTEYALGDINTASIPLISAGNAGRGLFYSTLPFSANNSIQSGQVELIGELPIGYEIDLAQNGQLIGFQENQNENGEYSFIVNVQPGMNIFELTFYGSQGQKYTKTEKYYIPVNSIGEGKFGTKFNVIQENTNLFAENDDVGATRIELQTEYGLNSMSALYAALVSYEVDEKRENYSLFRLTNSLLGIRTDYSVVVSDDMDYGAGLRLQGIHYGINWNIDFQNVDNLQSEYKKQLSAGFDVKNVVKGGLSGVLPLTTSVPFYLTYEGLFSSREKRNKVNLNITKPFTYMRFTTNFAYKKQTYKDDYLEANIKFVTGYNQFNFRGGSSFDLLPDYKFRVANLTASYLISKKYNINLDYKHSPDEDSVSLGYGQTFEDFSFGFNSAYGSKSGFSASLNVNVNFGYNPLTENLFMTSDTLAEHGAIVSNVFFDENDNSKFDKNEQKLSNIKFIGNNSFFKNKKTDDNGKVYFHGVSTFSRLKLKLDPTSFDDISLYSKNKHIDYSVKPSQLLFVDFPVVFRGEIDGQVFKYTRGEDRAGESIEFELVQWRTGAVINEVKSQYDGFILFKDVPSDRYVVRAKQSQVEDLNLCEPDLSEVILNRDNPFASLITTYIFENNEPNKVDVVFWEGKNIQYGYKQWQKIMPMLTNTVFSRSENAFSYLRRYQQSDWELIFDNIQIDDAKRYCRVLKENNIYCNIRHTEKRMCPKEVLLLEQINVNG